jgi:hypothetical protein
MKRASIARFAASLAFAAALAAALAIAPAGCSDESKLTPFQEPATPGATFETSVPYDGQDQVPLSAAVVLFFNAAIDPETAKDRVVFERVDDDGTATPAAFALETGRQTITVRPAELLLGNATYRVRLGRGLRTMDEGEVALPDRGALVQFTTRGDRPLAATDPRLVALTPSGDLVRDFSTFHLYYNEPLDEDTVVGGRTVTIQDAATGAIVPARVLSKGTIIVVDPLADLTPDVEYRIVVTNDVKDLDGDPVASSSYRVVPVSTKPLHDLVVEACPTAGTHSSACGPREVADLPMSRLTNLPVNSMITRGKVLGESRAFLSGPLFAALGTSHRPLADVIPVVLRAGQKLRATNIDALLGGEVPSGLSTGEITLTLLTDAGGYITDATQEAGVAGVRPRVTLIMDAALNAADPKANASFSQEILGVELSGFSVVDPKTGIMRMELGGMSEVFIMGERVASVMTMYQVAPPKYPTFVPDADAPRVATVTPLPDEELVPTETPIVVNFDEPVDPDSVPAAVALYDGRGNRVEAVQRVEGGRVVLLPTQPLKGFAPYEVRVAATVRDLAGNAIAAPFVSSFETNGIGYDLDVPPRVGTTVPANEWRSEFPCNFEPMLFFTADVFPGTVTYGDSVRIVDVETEGVVEATAVASYRKVVLRPARYLTPGRAYQVEVTEDVLSLGGRQLDTDRDYLPGGRPFTLDFIAGPVSGAVPLVLHAEPLSDRNGDGFFDDKTEVATPANQIAIQSVLITDPSYVQGDLVSFVHGLTRTADGRAFLDIDLSSGIRLGATSTSLDLEALLSLLGLLGKDAWNPLEALDMGPIAIDVVTPGSAPIAYDQRLDAAVMSINMDTYFSVANGLFNALLAHDLALEQTGVLSFADDGRMVVAISGKTDITMAGLLTMTSLVSMRAVSDPLP